MLVKSVLSAGLAATAAHAFVVIPIADADRTISDLLPFDAPSRAHEQSIDIACPGCPVDIKDGVAVDDVPNHLEMTFSIDTSSNGDSLLANGFELYPNPDPFANSLVAPQVTEPSNMDDKAHVKVQRLGYRFHVYPIAKEEESQQLELIGVDLQVVEVGGAFVNGIPAVKIRLVKNGDSLAIANVQTVEAAPAFGANCTTLLCKWRAFIANKIAAMRGSGRPCHGNKEQAGPGPHGHPHGMHGGMNGMPHGMPHGGPPHLPHHPAMSSPPSAAPEGQFHHPAPFHHGHRHHGLAHVFIMILTHILLPILIGIAAGVTASIVGMILVSIVLRVYKVIRGRKPAPEQPPSYKADPSEAVLADEEKAGLMEDQEHLEPPPSYPEETPAAKL